MAQKPRPTKCRNLVLVLGDQLNADSTAFDDFDRKQDAVWMAEVAEESTHVWTHKARIVMFLASMRRFRDALTKRKISVHYRQLDDRGNRKTLAAELEATVKKLKPQRLVLVEPGEWRVRKSLLGAADRTGVALDYGYAHHIQRLMVTGLFTLLLGVDPTAVHEWYLAVYVDAVEWVELPNSLGMSQFADGGVMASKPYVATGKYIQRMSNYCRGCRFDPAKADGEDACPFTTLYWDFLVRHKNELKRNNRMTMQLKNLDRKRPGELKSIRKRASQLRVSLCSS